jgi:hypothetical protein
MGLERKDAGSPTPFDETYLDAMYTANLKLALPDMLNFTASYRNDPSGDYNSAAIAGVEILAAKSLGVGIALAGNLDGLQAFGDIGYASIYQSLTWDASNFSLALNAAQYFDPGEKVALDTYTPGLWFWFHGAYKGLAEGKLVPRLDLNYFIGGAFGAFDRKNDEWAFNNNIHYDNFSANHIKGLSTFNVRPSASFSFDKRTWIELGYIFNLMIQESDSFMDHAIYAGIRAGF